MASCKGAWESKWPRSRKLGISAELGTEQYPLCQGCSAEPWLAPVSFSPKVKSVSTRPPPQGRASVLFFCWDSHSHWRLGCADTTLAPPQASLSSAVPALMAAPLSHYKSLEPRPGTSAASGCPGHHLKNLTATRVMLWETSARCLTQRGCYPPPFILCLGMGYLPPLAFQVCGFHRILNCALGKDSG